MKLELSGIQRVVHDLMVDTCTIYHDNQRTADDYWDEDAGKYVKPTNDDNVVYDGPCFASQKSDGVYEISIEVDAPDIKERSLVVYGTSLDPRLNQQRFYVQEQYVGTYQAARRLRVARQPVTA